MSFALRLLTWLCAPLVNEDSARLLNQVMGLSQQFATSGEELVPSELGKRRVMRGSL